MSKVDFKPGTFLYPIPAVLVTSKYENAENVFTVAWTGIVCSDPAMTYISVRKERYSHELIEKSGCFCINLPTEELTYATDYAGVRSGKKEDKFKKLNLTKEKSSKIDCINIKESPVVIECKVTEIKELGSHDMFLAEIVAVRVDEKYIDANDKFDMEKCNLIAYMHGGYFKIGEKLGKFGYSVKKDK